MSDDNDNTNGAAPRDSSRLAGSTLKWEDVGEDRIHGYMDNPKITLFIIERHPRKRYRGRMTGAVIPDEEDGKGLNQNALITWLKGYAAPGYLRDFQQQLEISRESERIDRLTPDEVRAELNALGYTDQQIDKNIQDLRAKAQELIAAGRSNTKDDQRP